MSEFIQVLTTVEKLEDAQTIAKALLERRWAACAQILGPIQSAYRWQGKIAEAQEWLVLIKSRRELYPQIEQAIRALHPYTVPEILAIPIIAGNPAYLEWLQKETRS